MRHSDGTYVTTYGSQHAIYSIFVKKIVYNVCRLRAALHAYASAVCCTISTSVMHISCVYLVQYEIHTTKWVNAVQCKYTANAA